MIYKPEQKIAKESFLKVREKFVEVEKLIVIREPVKDIIIDRENGAMIELKNKEAFFTLISEIMIVYWKLIDMQKLEYKNKKLISFCNKAYPEAKYSFEIIYKAYRFLERRISRCYALIMNPDQTKIFLIKNHSPTEMSVGYGLSGGKTEFDESFEQCLKRELYEEIGVTINPNQLEEYIEFSHHHRTIRVYKLILPEFDYSPKNQFEIEEAKWFSLSENMPKLVLVTSHSLKKFGIKTNCNCLLCKQNKSKYRYAIKQHPIAAH